MNDIGKALAGNGMVRDRNNPIMDKKYVTPFSEWIKGMVEDCKGRTKAGNNAYDRILTDRISDTGKRKLKHLKKIAGKGGYYSLEFVEEEETK